MSNVRTVTFFSTKGQNKQKVETDVTSWGPLMKIAQEKGYDVKNLFATESITKTDLAHKDAAIPAGPFVVFFRPKKTKSGAGLKVEGLSFGELRKLVKQNKEVPGFMEHLNGTGNYTQLKTDDLREVLSKWVVPTEKKAKKEKVAEVIVEEVADTVEEVADVTEDVVTPTQKVERIESILESLLEDFDGNDDIKERIEMMQDETAGLKVEIGELEESTCGESEEDRIAREAQEEADRVEADRIAEEKRLKEEAKAEAKRLEKEEDARLAQEAKDLCKELGC